MAENSTTDITDVDVGSYLTPITERKQREIHVEKPPDYLEITDDQIEAPIYTYINDGYLRPRDPPITGELNRPPPAYERLQRPSNQDQAFSQSEHASEPQVVQIQPNSLPPTLVTDDVKTVQIVSDGQVLQIPNEGGGTTIIVNQSAVGAKTSIIGHIAFSCFVFWCCNFLFGAAAFSVALASLNGSERRRRKLERISVGLNVAGIILTIIIISATVGSIFYRLNASRSTSPAV